MVCVRVNTLVLDLAVRQGLGKGWSGWAALVKLTVLCLFGGAVGLSV